MTALTALSCTKLNPTVAGRVLGWRPTLRRLGLTKGRGDACTVEGSGRRVNRASLLNQLKIDRDPVSSGPRNNLPWGWILGGVAAVVVIAALVWFLIARPDLPRVHVAAAQAVASSSAGAGASLLDASGYVVARRQATVSSKITGMVQEVLIEEGQHVQAGEVVARLDPSNARANLEQATAQVAAASSNLDVAKVALANAGPKYERDKQLHTRGWLSDQAVEDAGAAYDTARYNLQLAQRQLAVSSATRDISLRALDDTTVRAPFAGVITVKAAQPGEIVSPISAGGGFTRTGIGTIVDMDSLEVEVDVAESFINRVQQGMPATVKLNAYPDWEIPAQVIAVIPTADRSKATVTVRVGFKVRDPRIVPEMGARVAFLSPAVAGSPVAASARSVLVPADAVQAGDSADQGVVFVASGGVLERRAVRLGARRPEGQVLLSAVAPGDEVVVGGLDKLRDGEKVRVLAGPASTSN